MNTFIYMARGPSIEKTAETQARLLSAARTLFSKHGATWTMTDLAREAQCSVGLAYRYYPSRDAFVLAMYGELSAAFSLKADALTATTVGGRFSEIARFKLRCLNDERTAYLSLASIALSSEKLVGVLSATTSSLRHAGEQAFLKVVRDESPAEALPFARLLYALHLLVVLVWTQDKRPDSQRTDDLVDELGRAIDTMWPLRSLPMVRGFVSRIDAWWQTFA